MSADLCKAGLHPMEGENLGVQRSTGRRYCKACKSAKARARRPKKGTICRNKHDLTQPENIEFRDGRPRCKACRLEAQARRNAKRREEREVEAAGPEPTRVGQPSFFRRDASAYDRHRARAGYENGLDRPARPGFDATPPEVRRVRWFAGTDPAPPG